MGDKTNEKGGERRVLEERERARTRDDAMFAAHLARENIYFFDSYTDSQKKTTCGVVLPLRPKAKPRRDARELKNELTGFPYALLRCSFAIFSFTRASEARGRVPGGAVGILVPIVGSPRGVLHRLPRCRRTQALWRV